MRSHFLFLQIILSFSLVAKDLPTATPIKHLIVIFQENRTFDHYFGIYPYAENNPGETKFTPKKGTPPVNGFSQPLLKQNPNRAQPFRLSPTQARIVCDPDHDYTPIQRSCHCGLMDHFVEGSGVPGCPKNPSIVMGYFDGNTVTALWNYAQHFAMSDNFHSTALSESTLGAINLITGQTHGAYPENIAGFVVQGTIINDIDPLYDQCPDLSTDPKMRIGMEGINVGNLLNEKKVTWGWFQGGFSNCNEKHMTPDGPIPDYAAHHNPFQYYKSTSNPKHLPPVAVEMIGKTDQANHLYALSDFWAAAKIGNVPSVCFFKAPQYQNGHPGNSTPILEQEFLVETINQLQALPQWKDMAIIIAYDDSGGWYDHQMPPIVNHSQIPEDVLTGQGQAGSHPPMGGYQGRPGYGLRVPFLLISPWAKENFVDSTLTDQSSILRFIEDNWYLGRIGNFSYDEFAGSLLSMFDFKKRKMRYLILDPKTGAITSRALAKSEVFLDAAK